MLILIINSFFVLGISLNVLETFFTVYFEMVIVMLNQSKEILLFNSWKLLFNRFTPTHKRVQNIDPSNFL
jgi:hypothetical protein